ncbi:hypothetical protein PPL_01324 [Heterostelium album PN500]|uniref:Uncharacterized protein n=1 Tax=Heterostelium pallidum (strain ATCC 26659 / Pp 5 / PN500) TaxID=670386 RepID=D3AYR0_HETP5|nr:hypothetical protein PPL_01324 [Heterostelium album PN500]EFA86087.1 hypothetical protein PPL_01324 [Heterostelium album PN500]|eukprot:XP_020438193.1 hypothetical protein PPL_01324 [Heterostelium album PN500]
MIVTRRNQSATVHLLGCDLLPLLFVDRISLITVGMLIFSIDTLASSLDLELGGDGFATLGVHVKGEDVDYSFHELNMEVVVKLCNFEFLMVVLSEYLYVLLSCPTRWTYVYQMVIRYLELKVYIDQILLDQSELLMNEKEMDMLDDYSVLL